MKKPSMWTVIICGALILTLATGLRQTMGLFLKPISLDLEIGREVFGFGIAIQNLLWGLAAPFAGAMADRYGTGRVGVIGGLLYMIGLAVMGLSTGGGTLTFANFFIGIGLGFTGFSAVLGAVGRVTPPEKRSVALGIVTAGGSFGQFAVVPYGHLLLDGWGWQIALFVLAGTAFLMVPLSRGIAGFIGVQNTTGQSMKGALGEAFTHRGYQLMVAGFFVCGFHVAFVATHLPAYLADKAMPSWLGAWTLATIGLFNIAGSYVWGWLGGRYRKKWLLSILYTLRAVVFLCFILAPLSNASVLIFGGALGFLWLGTVPLTSGLVAQIFGLTYMSTLYGVVFLSHQVGSFFGAWMGGYLFDLTGSYQAMWWFSVALGLFSGVVHLPIADQPMARLNAKPAAASA